MILDEDLKKQDLQDISDVLMDAYSEGEGPLSVAQIQYRLSTHPRIQRSISRERIERTLGWGLHQPNTIDHPGRIGSTGKDQWSASPRWKGK